jgi:hypothetical protein
VTASVAFPAIVSWIVAVCGRVITALVELAPDEGSEPRSGDPAA